MKKPRVCFVCQNIYPLLNRNVPQDFMGGAELQQSMIGCELEKRGYPVSFITLDHGRQGPENIGPFAIIPTFPPNEGIRGLRFFYPRLYKIWRALRKADADIYYVRCAGFILAPVVLHALLNGKKAVFCGACDLDFDPNEVELNNLKDKSMYFWGVRRCHAIVVQNQAQQGLLLRHFSRKGRIIHNGFPRAGSHSNAGDGEEVLWVGMFRGGRNPEMFLELARRIPDGRFTMIGGLPPGTAGEQLVKSKQVAEQARTIANLDFKGFVPFERTEGYFARARLLVSTSDFEGFPNTFLQAWSRGIPVISFVDPDDLIKRHHLGLVVRSFEEMVEGARAILDCRIQFSAHQIIAFFQENLSIEKSVDEYEALFASLSPDSE